MPDWDGNDLALLAPEVDHAASRALFERRRAQRRRRRRMAAVGAVVAVVVLASAGLNALVQDEGEESLDTGFADGPTTSVPSSRPAVPADQPLFEVLGVHERAAFGMGTLRSAVDADELAQLWSDAGFADEPPEIDFDRWIVVSITIPDDACPPTLTDFTRDGDVWTPAFVETADVCNQPLIPKTYVVAINRAEAGSGFTLHLPGQPTYDFPDQDLRVDVPATSPPSTFDPGGRFEPVPPPPADPDAPLTVWVSSDPLPPSGGDLAIVVVNHSDVQGPTFGVSGGLQRWDGSTWQDHRQATFCIDFWLCTGSLHALGEEVAVPSIGVTAPPGSTSGMLAVHIEGLEPGWYRIVVADGVEGRFEVEDGAPTPAPIAPSGPIGAGETALIPSPPVVAPDGGTLSLSVELATNDGPTTAEDVAALQDALSTEGSIQWFDGGAWVDTGERSALARVESEALGEGLAVDVPPLAAGGYRIEVQRTDGGPPVFVRFWVVPDA
jgi:hypothetical protein